MDYFVVDHVEAEVAETDKDARKSWTLRKGVAMSSLLLPPRASATGLNMRNLFPTLYKLRKVR